MQYLFVNRLCKSHQVLWMSVITTRGVCLWPGHIDLGLFVHLVGAVTSYQVLPPNSLCLRLSSAACRRGQASTTPSSPHPGVERVYKGRTQTVLQSPSQRHQRRNSGIFAVLSRRSGLDNRLLKDPLTDTRDCTYDLRSISSAGRRWNYWVWRGTQNIPIMGHYK